MKRLLQLMLGLNWRNFFRGSPAACATAKHVLRFCTPYTVLQCSGDAGGSASTRVTAMIRRHTIVRAAEPRFAIAMQVVWT